MAIVTTLLTSGGSDTNSDSYTTASIAPTGSVLVTAIVFSRFNSVGNVPTLTGNGITWVEVKTQRTSDNILRMTIFRGMVASPSSGTVVIDFAAQTQEHCEWIIAEHSSVDTGGTNGSSAVVQSAGNRDEGTNTGLTVTLAAFGAADNVAYGGVRAGNTISPGSGFTELAEVSAATEAPFIESEYKANDTTVDWTWSSTSSFTLGVAIEIKYAAPATAIKTVNGLAKASVKTVNGLAIASVKTINGLA